MARSTVTRLRTELRSAQRKYGQFQAMELLIPDLNAILKGKRVRKEDFEKVIQDGFWFCAGTTLLTALGETVPGIPFGQDDGDPDVFAEIVPGSIAPVPWATRPMGQALFRLFEDDRVPLFSDPRSVLERAMQPLGKMGLKMVMATELEFYLLDAKTDRPTVAMPHVPGVGRLQPGAQVYHPEDLWEIEHFLNDVYDYCDAQNIPPTPPSPSMRRVNSRSI